MAHRPLGITLYFSAYLCICGRICVFVAVFVNVFLTENLSAFVSVSIKKIQWKNSRWVSPPTPLSSLARNSFSLNQQPTAYSNSQQYTAIYSNTQPYKDYAFAYVFVFAFYLYFLSKIPLCFHLHVFFCFH